MKIKRLAKWAILSLLFQLAGLTFINYYILSGDNGLRSERESIYHSYAYSDDEEQRDPRELGIELPKGAEQVSTSHDEGYVSWLTHGSSRDTLTVSKVKGTSRSIRLPRSTVVDYMRWLPDRDRLLYLTQAPTEEGGEVIVRLWYYDAQLRRNGLIRKIDIFPDGSKARSMALSAITNLIYITVDGPGERTYLYRVDVMGKSTQIRQRNRVIDEMLLLPETDTLYFVEKGSERVMVLSNGEISSFEDSTGTSVEGHLMGYDSKGRAVIASLKPGGRRLTSTLLFGDSSGDYSGYRDLGKPTDIDNVDLDFPIHRS